MLPIENSLQTSFDLRMLHGGHSDHTDKDQTSNILTKVLSIVVILGMTVAFGFFPYFW